VDITGDSQSLADNPCIGICSTTQWGDDTCKGCGRTALEIRDWNTLPSIERKLIVLRAVDQGYRPRQVQRYNSVVESSIMKSKST
jgi:predicted Fe-S protein YdhL (DUF1289 family)